MVQYNFDSFTDAVCKSWSEETSDLPNIWRKARPEIGHAAVTAVLLHDAFGGKIIQCHAYPPVPSEVGSHPHYYNELPQNTAGVISVEPEPLHPEFQIYDATGEQYPSDTIFGDLHACQDYDIVSPGLKSDAHKADKLRRYIVLRDKVKVKLGMDLKSSFPYQFSQAADKKRLKEERANFRQQNRKF